MHNIKELRKNLKKYKKKFLDRNLNFDEILFEQLDTSNREIINKKEKLEKEKKILSKTKDKTNFEKSKHISFEIENVLKKLTQLQNELNNILNVLPNIALDDVPIGKDSNTNKIIKKVGLIKKISFQPKSHIDLGIQKMGIDFETAINYWTRFVS